MTFEEMLDQAIALLQGRGRLTYRTLKRQFQLDAAALEDLTVELTEAPWKANASRSPRSVEAALTAVIGSGVASHPTTALYSRRLSPAHCR